MNHLSASFGMSIEPTPPLPEGWTFRVKEDGCKEWTTPEGKKRTLPPGKKVGITRTWWEEIRKMPDFAEVMKRKCLTEDDVYIIG